MNAAQPPVQHEAQGPREPAAAGEGPDHLVEVRITTPDEGSAERLAGTLVEGELAACVQTLGPITSVYTWQGRVQRDTEWLLLAKSTAAAFPRLCAVVQQVHPYDVPEILAVPVSHALPPYGEWVAEHTRTE